MSEYPEDVMNAAAAAHAEFAKSSVADNLTVIIARAILSERNRNQWQPISTAPDFDRIMIAGWKEPRSGCAGYWWYEEGMAENGKDMVMKDATHWCPLIVPDFPAPPIPHNPTEG